MTMARDLRVKLAVAMALTGLLAAVLIVLGGGRAGAEPAERYYVTPHTGTVYAVAITDGHPGDPRALSFAAWRELGSPAPEPAPTDFVKYPWSPTVYAVTFWATGWEWDEVTFPEWQRAGFPSARVAGYIAGSSYYRWDTSDEVFVRGADGVVHPLTFDEWAASGFRPYERRQNQGFVKLSWDSHIARMTDYVHGMGYPVDYATWVAEGRPTPHVQNRFVGDIVVKDFTGPGVQYSGPSVSRYMTYPDWVAAGRPAPYTGRNGRLDTSSLCSLSWQSGPLLRCDAAEALTRLNGAYSARFNKPLVFDGAYRTYARQAQLRAQLGTVAAVPGTSNHGWGLAIDTPEGAESGFGNPAYEWLRTVGPQYGWVSPGWAQQGGSNPEYWHFEYTG